MKTPMSKLIPSLFFASLIALLVGCGGATDTSEENERNTPPPVDEVDDGIVYNGPVAATDDVTAFRIHVWEALTQDDRCGGCHNEEQGQEPIFMRRDNINLAYELTLPLVDKAAPVLSTLVQRAQEGHNAWNDSAPDLITNMVQNWATATGASANVVILTPSEDLRPVGEAYRYPPEPDSYEQTIYPLVRGQDIATDEVVGPNGAQCYTCHAEDGALQQQQPFFASLNVETAYEAARTLIQLSDEGFRSSRLIERMEEGHNTWADPSGSLSNQAYSAQQMTAAISAFLGRDDVQPQEVPANWVTSSAAIIEGVAGEPGIGQVASAGGRVETDVVALYQFKQGSGFTAYDLSTVEPQLNLSLSPTGVDWVSSWGLRFYDNGKAQADTNSSSKLNDLIRLTGEYSIEAWVVPGNVTQEESRIVTYSGSNSTRNFALMQTLYDYQFLSRSEFSEDENGMPLLSTLSGDEVLQATLQHVVTTYDPIDGRRIYVNGELVAQDDGSNTGNINDWDDGFVLALGNEVDSANDWEGTIRLLAIHNRVLDDDQVLTNFNAGVGQKYYLFFSVAEQVGQDDAYIVFQVEQFDESSYLFQDPFFMILDSERSALAADFRIRGMRIGINGKEATVGQAFANMDLSVTVAGYSTETGFSLVDRERWPLGTVIALENGIASDEFFLTFEEIGNCGVECTYDRDPDFVPEREDPRVASGQEEHGIRMFDEIFQTMSAITTVPSSEVYEFYASDIRRSLPASPAANGFLASQQAAITQLALAYCSELINTPSLHDAMFTANYGDLTDQTMTRNFLDPLLERFLIVANPVEQMQTAPVADEIRVRLFNENAVEVVDEVFNPEEFDGLLQVLEERDVGEEPLDINLKAIAVCTSVLASATTLMQ